MIDAWALWLLVVGLAIGVVGSILLLARLPRQDDDVGEAERRAEAAWIAGTIERHGGVAPTDLVEEVLDLHHAYLQTSGVPASQVEAAMSARQTAPPTTGQSPGAPLDAPPPVERD